MIWTIPGTVLQANREDARFIQEQFSSMFLAGDLMLGQVAGITGLEPYTIQNWVKRGFLTAPQKKRYTLRQLCRIININMLKSVLPLERICALLGYVNGQLDDESDDLIDDSVLFFMFVRLAARSQELYTEAQRAQALDELLADYREPVPGAKQRVRQALQIMLAAWMATKMRQQTERMLSELEETVQSNPNL